MAKLALWSVVERAAAECVPVPITLALDSLPTKYRRVLELRFGQGLSFNETARLLHLPPADLRKRIGAAVRNVKRKLDEAAQLEEILPCYLG